MLEGRSWNLGCWYLHGLQKVSANSLSLSYSQQQGYPKQNEKSFINDKNKKKLDVHIKVGKYITERGGI